MRLLGMLLVALLLAGCVDPATPQPEATSSPMPQYAPVEPLGWVWQEAEPLPAPVAGAACVADRGTLYLFGGRDDAGILVPFVWSYRDGQGWAREVSMTESRQGSTAVVVSTGIQIIGGFEDTAATTPTDTVLERNAFGGFFTPGPDLPSRLAQASALRLDGGIYLAGGTQDGEAPTDRILSWDPFFGWGREGRLAAPVTAPALLPINETLFLVAGGTSDGPSGAAYLQDLEGQRMIDMPPVPTPRGHTANAASGNRLFLIGGIDAEGTVRASAEYFDAEVDLWYTLKGVPVPVFDACAVAMEDGVHVIGGADADGDIRSEHWVLVPELEVGDQE